MKYILVVMNFTKTFKSPRLRSLCIVHLSMLVFSLGNSIIFTGVWPYLQEVFKKKPLVYTVTHYIQLLNSQSRLLQEFLKEFVSKSSEFRQEKPDGFGILWNCSSSTAVCFSDFSVLNSSVQPPTVEFFKNSDQY